MSQAPRKSRFVPREYWDGLYTRIKDCNFYVSEPAGTTIYMLDDEFQPTQNMAEVKLIMTDSHMDAHIFQIDGIGDAIFLKPS